MAVENDLINPREVVRPYSGTVKFTPGGQGLLIDNVVILAVSIISRIRPEAQLSITTDRLTPILREDTLSRGEFWQERVRRSQTEARLNPQSQYGTVTRRISDRMSPMYIGTKYKLSYLCREGILKCFRIYSTTPMQAVPINGDAIYWQILQRAQRHTGYSNRNSQKSQLH